MLQDLEDSSLNKFIAVISGKIIKYLKMEKGKLFKVF